MRISIIAAMSHDLLIGTATGLPWKLPADLQRFRKLTMGKPVIMGRKTFELIGKPLPGRHNIVLTGRASHCVPGCELATSLEEAFALGRAAAQRSGADEIMVIGGSAVYREAIAHCTKLYLTFVEGTFAGTAYFPSELPDSNWCIVQSEEYAPDEKNPHAYRYMVLEHSESMQDRVSCPRLICLPAHPDVAT